MSERRLAGRLTAAGGMARALVAAALALPLAASALEPRFDHRYQQGPTAEFLFARDQFWRGSTDSSSSSRGAVRLAWGYDPTGDGDELSFGATLSVIEFGRGGGDRTRLAVDARYRALAGTEQFKTLLDVGLWASAVDAVAVGPLVGLGFVYDFNRNFGVFTSVSLAAAIGENRVVSFGGGAGAQYRFE